MEKAATLEAGPEVTVTLEVGLEATLEVDPEATAKGAIPVHMTNVHTAKVKVTTTEMAAEITTSREATRAAILEVTLAATARKAAIVVHTMNKTEAIGAVATTARRGVIQEAIQAAGVVLGAMEAEKGAT